MAKDILGNEIKAGEKVMFQGMVFLVKELNENRVIGGKTITGRNVTGIKIPDVMLLEIELQFDAEKPFNGVIVKQPLDSNTDKVN
jgi:hypothetical protein